MSTAAKILSACLFTTACTNIFVQPSRDRYSELEAKKMVPEQLELQSQNGMILCAWKFPAKQSQGMVLQVHGNAQNMSAHFEYLSWLPFSGYDLVTFDYRGYGCSDGNADVGGSVEDTKAAIRFMDQEAGKRGLKWSLVGQSLGGTLSLRALEEQPTKNLGLIVIDSSFYSYRGIAREKLASMWITWPFQWLPYLLITDQYSPKGQGLKSLAPNVPVVLMHSEKDPVVPINQGEQIYSELREPKEFWRLTEPGHIHGFAMGDKRYRNQLVEKLKSNLQQTPRHPSSK